VDIEGHIVHCANLSPDSVASRQPIEPSVAALIEVHGKMTHRYQRLDDGR
jgi:hypothetical protein